MGMATVGVYKSGPRLLINIPKNVIISEEIKPGDLIDITIHNTGKKREKTKFKNFQGKKPSTLPTKQTPTNNKIPAEIINKLLSYKTKDVSTDFLKAKLEEDTDHTWNELPEDVKKKLETEPHQPKNLLR